MISIIFLICFITAKTFSTATPHVQVEEGELIGTSYNADDGRIIYSFYGIPYAASPVFKYRFMEPQPLNPWVGIWNATKYSSYCYQYDHHSYSLLGEEDCLYLNVFTPKLPENGISQLMDVIVYIHGGAFMFGSGNGQLQPDYLLKKGNYVYVTVNYRLGPLGFFSTGDGVVPGNNGLKDQVAAFKWIQRNIAKFGGNPASVTIMGMSAGGASVHYHYLSPLSKGLFHRGISYSGTVLPSWTLPKNVTHNSFYLASMLGCPTNTTTHMIKCLKMRPAKQIVEAVKTFVTWRYCPFTTFGPVIESEESRNPFLSSSPFELLVQGKVSNLPWLFSASQHEGLYPVADFIHSEDLLQELDDKWYLILPHLLHYNYISDPVKNYNVSAEIRKFYFGQQNITKFVIDKITQMVGDRLFYVPIKKAAKLYAATSSVPVYCYKFNYRGKYSMSGKYARNNENYGVSHGDDLMYILKVSYGNPDEDETDREMIGIMTTVISEFIRSGRPRINNVSWPPVSRTKTVDLSCLEISSPVHQKLRAFNDPKIDEFWNFILPETYPEFSSAKTYDEF